MKKRYKFHNITIKEKKTLKINTKNYLNMKFISKSLKIKLFIKSSFSKRNDKNISKVTMGS